MEKENSNTFCEDNCKGYQETKRCFCDGRCEAYLRFKESTDTEVVIQRKDGYTILMKYPQDNRKALEQ